MINNNLDTKKIAKDFKSNKAIRIDNFLDVDYANDLHNFFTEEMPKNWWSLSTWPKRPGWEDEVTDNIRLEDDPDTKAAIAYKKVIADDTFQRGEFSYSFKRTLDDHVDHCECKECKLRSFLSSSDVIKFINKITKSDVTESGTLFASLYEEGDFLSIHHDGPNGKIGFVYNLCPGWRADWGGLLHTLDDEEISVTKTYVPGFNTLTLFDSSQETGYPHYVSHVLNKDAKRISFTGWYK